MKKFLLLLLSITLALGISACGGVPDNSSSDDVTESTSGEDSSETVSSEEVSSEEESASDEEESSSDEDSSETVSSEEVSSEEESASSEEESSSGEDSSETVSSEEVSSEEESASDEEESTSDEDSSETVNSEEVSSEEESASSEEESSSDEDSSEEISSEENSSEEDSTSSEDSSSEEIIYDYEYKIVQGGIYFSSNTSLIFKFINADDTVNLGYTDWSMPDEGTKAFMQYIKINGEAVSSVYPDAYVQGLNQRDGLCLAGISLNAGDEVTIDKGAVFTHDNVKMTLAIGLSYTWNGTDYDISETEYYVVAVSYYDSFANANEIALRFSNHVDVMNQNTLDLGYDLSGAWYRTDTAFLDKIFIKGVVASQIDGIFLASMGQADGMYISSDATGGLNMQVGDTIVIPEGITYTTSGGVTITTMTAFTYTWNGTSYDVTRGLMWNTKELFNIVPEQRAMPELNLGANITAFKFKSAPTETKTETWVFGAIGVPTTAMPEGGYPAVVLVHGGAGYVRTGWINYWTEKGFVAIAIDMWGNQLDANGNKVSNPDSGFVEKEPYYYGIENPEYSWVYHSVYNVIMAHNIVRARADVNAEKTAITGISWGGYITNIVSGVDTRFKAVAPVYGCGYISEDSFWTERYKAVFGTNGVWDGPEKQAWICLYDPSSYVPYAKAPMLFISGVNDVCFSTMGRIRTANLYHGEKAYYSQRYGFDHGDYWEATYEIYAFFQEVLYGTDMLTEIGNVTVSGGVATFNYSGTAKFDTVKFVYTTSTDADSHKWVWTSVTVTANNGVYSYTLPAGVKAYYFETMTSDNLLHQSTKITLVNA